MRETFEQKVRHRARATVQGLASDTIDNLVIEGTLDV